MICLVKVWAEGYFCVIQLSEVSNVPRWNLRLAQWNMDGQIPVQQTHGLKKKKTNPQQGCVLYAVRYATLEVQLHNKCNKKGYNQHDVDNNHFIINVVHSFMQLALLN